jgi:hypothetical protein
MARFTNLYHRQKDQSKKIFCMKKSLLFFVFYIFSLNLFAQQFHLECSNSTYTEISSGNYISQDILWSQYYCIVPLGFTFNINGNMLDSVFVADVGNLGFMHHFPVHPLGYWYWGLGANYINLPFDTSNTKIWYTTTGTTGTRIFKVEYHNCGFSNGDHDQDSANFQIWLYESDNSIETHVGPVNAAHPSDEYQYGMGPIVGIINVDNNDNIVYSYMLTGSTTTPTITTASDILSFPELNGTPSPGQVYRFVPGPAGKEEIAKTNQISVFPNPSEGIFTIHYSGELPGNARLQVFNMLGNIVYKEAPNDRQSQQIDLSRLAQGMYYIRIENTEHSFSEKIVIER